MILLYLIHVSLFKIFIQFEALKINELSFSFFKNFQSKKENTRVENINIMKIDEVKKENKKEVQS